MKKKTTTIILIVVAAVLCAALVVGIAFWNTIYTAISNRFYAENAQTAMQAHFESDVQGIRNIRLDFSNEDIYVVQTNESKIRIEEACSMPIDQQQLMQCSVNGDTVTAQSGMKNRWSFNWHFGAVKVTLYVPAGYENNIDLNTSSGEISLQDVKNDTLKINTTSGDINAGNTLAAKMEVNSTSGDIHLGNAQAGALDVGATSGEITVNGGNFDTVSAQSSSGDIQVEAKHAGSVDMHASSGEVKVAVDEMPGQIKVDTSSGDVTLRLPENDGFTLERQCSSGKTHNDFAVVNGSVYKNGQVSVYVKTSSGNLNLIKK